MSKQFESALRELEKAGAQGLPKIWDQNTKSEWSGTQKDLKPWTLVKNKNASNWEESYSCMCG